MLEGLTTDADAHSFWIVPNVQSTGAAPRRVIHLEYACETTFGDGIELDVT